ncbi:type VII secretion protein EccB [Nocardia sp. CDC160]|uniref:type VII secretion protein EccB n=1 Tax=Nocardia sp. CDC160 TaxID=3112166 RepID=UPI002DBB2754|nr:type VII secretion protein EccB [Nocardia sp. CDC160]MEC3920347.1 type VII secretion protein EccB [Nocardia sp. CDC160]
MPSLLTTRAQVNGYRFLVRRLEHAMVRRDVRMLHDPMSSQLRSLIIGLVLAVLATAGCAILAILRPQGTLGDAHIVVGKDSGALYVVVDNVLHPALNLASARLIVGSAESPTSVKDAKLSAMARGPILGIPGAPAALPLSGSSDSLTWALCDTIDPSPDPGEQLSTTVLAGAGAVNDHAREISSSEALLAERDGQTFLLYNGQRAHLDLGNDVIVRALRLQGAIARPISSGLLDATVEVPAIAPPAIPHEGESATGRLSNLRVGTVIKVIGVQSTELYVIVSDGVQRVSAFAADLIRAADSQGMSEITVVPPDALKGVPVRDELPIDTFPTQRPTIIPGADAPVACIAWSKFGAGPAVLHLMAGSRVPLPDSAKPVTMASSPADDHAGAAYIPASTGEYVQATGIEPDSTRRDSLFYVADNGIRYGIPDTGTATMLGLSNPRPAPWQILSQFVAGPTLTRTSALTAYDRLPQ